MLPINATELTTGDSQIEEEMNKTLELSNTLTAGIMTCLLMFN